VRALVKLRKAMKVPLPPRPKAATTAAPRTAIHA
jgi:hypothetical protein